jgi:hypothetical protein
MHIKSNTSTDNANSYPSANLELNKSIRYDVAYNNINKFKITIINLLDLLIILV